MKEGISYSESAMRSGISIDKQRIQKDLISAPEIMRLHALEAYMRLPGELPIIKVNFEYRNRNSNTPGFIAREITEKDLVLDTTAAESKAKEEPKVVAQETGANIDRSQSEISSKNKSSEAVTVQNVPQPVQKEGYNKELEML